MGRAGKPRKKRRDASTDCLVAVVAENRNDRFSRGNLPATAILVFAAIVAYSNSFHGAFILDDERWILQDIDIQRLWPVWPILFPADAVTVGGRPFVRLTLAFNYALGGTNAWGYHAVNLVIHILAACTLFGVFRQTLLLPQFRERFQNVATPLALAVSMLWVVHPLQTESVTYIIQRMESLMGLFYLLTLYCVIRSVKSSMPFAWHVAAVEACALGMATKEVMATAPLIVLLYDRTFLAGSFREAWRRRYVLYLALAATWGIVACLLFLSGFHGGTTGFTVGQFTWWSYLLTQSAVLVHYLRLVFWPVGLCLDYGWPAAQSINEVIIPAILVLGLLILAVWALVKRPVLGFLSAWFFVILAPTSSFVPIQDAAFEHRMYLPLATILTYIVMGVYLMGQWIVQHHYLSSRTLIITGASFFFFTLATLTFLTVGRNADYRSEISIWRDTIAKAPHNARAYNGLGNALVRCGRFEEAVVQDKIAIELSPGSAMIANNLAWLLATCYKTSVRNGLEAVEYAQRAVTLTKEQDPSYLDTLAAAYAEAGRFDDAVQTAQKAFRLASQQNKSALAASVKERMLLYEAKKPFHATPNSPFH
jgi:protein O-mannosyl-transferase